MRRGRSFWRNRSGAAAAEMALVVPLLVVIMLGSMEVAKFFWDEHIVLKSVRDGARFASRQSFANMPCDGTATNEDQIQNLVRYGVPIVTDQTPRLFYWDDNSTITVEIECDDNSLGTYAGIYAERDDLPKVTVSAAVPYTPIIGSFGFEASGLNLNAQSQATVVGI